jgi:isoamylase
MVAAFHSAGIEVWLDVVFNHTSEIDETGPTYSFRGIDNRSYYLLEPDLTTYVNDTGCGNTMRCGHAATRRLVLDSLRFWTEETGVDGFRFDLASIFTRSADGSLDLSDPAIVAEISAYGCAQDLRLVAEAWDIASYQLGHSFPGFTWLQWNGRFRDDVRAFVRGDEAQVPDLMRRLYGSDDLFPDTAVETYRPWQSVNFITAHDGFCLYDLVSYEQKRNLANGHENRDGSDNNLSWNCGHEGDDGVPEEVLALRRRQVRSFFCLLMLANGTPMLCAGDEFMQTQGGNNNPYNQDNATTWIDWGLLQRNQDVHRFFKLMIAFRKAHPSIARSRYWREDVRWYGVGPDAEMGTRSRSIAYVLDGRARGDDDLYVMINGGPSPLEFALQEGHPREWLRVVDTGAPSPEDIAQPGSELPLEGPVCQVRERAIVVLLRPRA